jgi:hypothetical protein
MPAPDTQPRHFRVRGFSYPHPEIKPARAGDTIKTSTCMNPPHRAQTIALVGLAAIALAAAVLYVVLVLQPSSSDPAAQAPKATIQPQSNELPTSTSSTTNTPTEITSTSIRTLPPQSDKSMATIQLLSNQLHCTQLEVAFIVDLLNNFNSQPIEFSSQAHFDSMLNKCFVLIQYDQFNGVDNSHVQAFYDATNNSLLECYSPRASTSSYETGCDDRQGQIQPTSTTHDPLFDHYMIE